MMNKGQSMDGFSRGWQIAAGFGAAAAVIALTVVLGFIWPDAMAPVAMFGMLALIGFAQVAAPLLQWNYFRYGVGIAVGLLMAAGIVLLALFIIHFPF